MDLIKAIVYGIIQGLTEFLPVSSSAHLRIIPALVGWEDPGAAFTAVIQLGTVAAVLIYFWKDLVQAFQGWFGSLTGKVSKDSHEAKVGWAVIYATIPVVIIGLLLKHQIEGVFRSIHIIAASMLVLGIGMWLAERFSRGDKSLESITPTDGLKVGLWQCLALVPGMSRSGSTITGALVAGYKRADAARFSFLMSVPSVAGAGFFEAFKERKTFTHDLLVPTIVATLISFVVGYIVIAWFIKYLQKRGVAVFVYYRVAVALILFFLMGTHRLDPNAGADPVDEKPVAAAQATH